MNTDFRKLAMPLIATLTLGLAPFFPEPHIFGKIKWISGGAEGMKMMDWFDFIFHGAPWAWLLISIIILFKGRMQSAK